MLPKIAAVLIAKKFQTKHTYRLLMVMGGCFFILTLALQGELSSKTAFYIISLTSAAILFFANIAGVFIIPGMQKACPQNMLGRLMALFNTCNSAALPIGIWLHGILYEKYDDKLSVIFGGIAVLTVLIAARGKRVYLQLQNGSEA